MSDRKPILVCKVDKEISEKLTVTDVQNLRSSMIEEVGLDYYVFVVLFQSEGGLEVLNGEELTEEKYNELINLIKDAK